MITVAGGWLRLRDIVFAHDDCWPTFVRLARAGGFQINQLDLTAKASVSPSAVADSHEIADPRAGTRIPG